MSDEVPPQEANGEGVRDDGTNPANDDVGRVLLEKLKGTLADAAEKLKIANEPAEEGDGSPEVVSNATIESDSTMKKSSEPPAHDYFGSIENDPDQDVTWIVGTRGSAPKTPSGVSPADMANEKALPDDVKEVLKDIRSA